MEITHMDWPRAVLHMEVSEVDSASLGWDQYIAETAEGNRSPNRQRSPCVLSTAIETGPVLASRRASWERECLFPSKEQRLPPQPWWRHKATGIARRGGPCTVMLALQCKAEKRSVSREDQDMKVRVLQVDRCKPIEGADALEDAILH